MTALAEKSLNIAYFPRELNSSALRSYFISGEAYDHKIGEITRETATPGFITSPKRHWQKNAFSKFREQLGRWSTSATRGSN